MTSAQYRERAMKLMFPEYGGSYVDPLDMQKAAVLAQLAHSAAIEESAKLKLIPDEMPQVLATLEDRPQSS